MGIVIELQYFAPIIFYKTLSSRTHLLFEQYEIFQKMSFRNRCVVAGANGKINLSIPLIKGRNQKTCIKDTRIDNTAPWQGQHWKTIVSCYNRSPWFEFYSDELNELYTTRYEFLVDWNFSCFMWVMKKVNFEISASMTDSWMKDYDQNRWDDWRNLLRPTTIHQLFPHVTKYQQVFQERIGFIPHLSILDLLFCEGKNTLAILKQ